MENSVHLGLCRKRKRDRGNRTKTKRRHHFLSLSPLSHSLSLSLSIAQSLTAHFTPHCNNLKTSNSAHNTQRFLVVGRVIATNSCSCLLCLPSLHSFLCPVSTAVPLSYTHAHTHTHTHTHTHPSSAPVFFSPVSLKSSAPFFLPLYPSLFVLFSFSPALFSPALPFLSQPSPAPPCTQCTRP